MLPGINKTNAYENIPTYCVKVTSKACLDLNIRKVTNGIPKQKQPRKKHIFIIRLKLQSAVFCASKFITSQSLPLPFQLDCIEFVMCPKITNSTMSVIKIQTGPYSSTVSLLYLIGLGFAAVSPNGFCESLPKNDRFSLELFFSNGFKTPLIVGFSISYYYCYIGR